MTPEALQSNQGLCPPCWGLDEPSGRCSSSAVQISKCGVASSLLVGKGLLVHMPAVLCGLVMISGGALAAHLLIYPEKAIHTAFAALDALPDYVYDAAPAFLSNQPTA